MFKKKMFGPRRNNECQYEIRDNENVEELCNEPSIVGALKSMIIRWAGNECKSAGIIGQIKNGNQTQRDQEDDLNQDGQIE